MPPAETLPAFIIASALLSIAPGPDNIFVLSQSALYGRKSGVIIVLGLCTGLLVHTAVVAFGVAVIFQTSKIAYAALRIIGALYLAYLAWQAFAAAGENFDTHPSPATNRALYGRGVMMNLTNPKVAIFFLAFLPQFAAPENGALAVQIFVLGAIFILVALLIFGAIAYLAGALGDGLRRFPKAQVYLNRTAGVVLAALALRLLLGG